MFSAREIGNMNLPGMPKSKPAIMAKARRECWPSEKRIVFGGTSEVYEIPAHYLSGTSEVYEISTHYLSGTEKEGKKPINRQETAKPAVAGAVSGGQQVDLAMLQQVEALLEEVLQAKDVRLLPDRRGAVVAFLYDYASKGAGVERLKAALQALVA